MHLIYLRQQSIQYFGQGDESDGSNDDSECTDVMVPITHINISLVLLFMGGGMGAGKNIFWQSKNSHKNIRF